jgi:hypothetical protein
LEQTAISLLTSETEKGRRLSTIDGGATATSSPLSSFSLEREWTEAFEKKTPQGTTPGRTSVGGRLDAGSLRERIRRISGAKTNGDEIYQLGRR